MANFSCKRRTQRNTFLNCGDGIKKEKKKAVVDTSAFRLLGRVALISVCILSQCTTHEDAPYQQHTTLLASTRFSMVKTLKGAEDC